MKNGYLFLVILAVLGLILVSMELLKRQREFDRTCFDLPRTGDARVFGPAYWDAFHTLSHKIPCSICRRFAEKFMVFFHDTVNLKLGKPLFDEANFKYFTRLFSDLDKGIEVFGPDYVQEKVVG